MSAAPGGHNTDDRPHSMRTGVRLGIDVGSVRIGVARTDPQATLAVPVETIDARPGISASVDRVVSLVAEYGAIEILVGHPIGMNGRPGAAAATAHEFAAQVALRIPDTPVRLVDERLSTVQAQGQLHRAGRTSKSSRGVIDQAAAVVLVQHAIETERAQGKPPGRLMRGIS